MCKGCASGLFHTSSHRLHTGVTIYVGKTGSKGGEVPWVLGGLAGRAIEVWRVHVDVWVVLGGLGWAGRCRVVPWVRGGWSWGVTGACGGGSCGACSSGVLWWCLGGLWTHMGGVCVAPSRLLDLWVTHRMLMEETQHVFPCGGVGELLCVCQQEALAVYHLGRCSVEFL